jgi:glycosyltransferase involved in cell wall biosynthesis
VSDPVLYVLPSLGYGGTERQLVLTLQALDRDAFPPSVLALMKGGPYVEQIRALGIPVEVAGSSRRGHVASARAVAAAARAHGARIVHTSLFEANVAGRIAARRVGALAVTHLVNEYESPHRALEREARTPRKAAWVKRIERWTARFGRARFIAVADVVADSAARFFGVDRDSIPVVRRGFVFDELEVAAARPLEAPAWSSWADPRLLAVGRLTPQKGHRYLARALPNVVEALPSAQVVLVGDGPLRAELETSARSSNLADHLSVPGTRGDVPSLLREAEAFVFPSLWEGAAGALVEAVALGTPVVATDIPSTREILPDHSSTLVRPRDPEALGEAIVGLFRGDRAGARARAEIASRQVREAHDIRANTKLLEDVYLRFLAQRS